jgi:hypothetical protein
MCNCAREQCQASVATVAAFIADADIVYIVI